MGRAWLPRRFYAVISAAAVGVAALAAAPSAAAQDPNTEARAVTVIGTDAQARRCGERVAAGDTSDRTVETCTRALSYRRITRESQIQVLVNRGVTYLRRREIELALADFDAVIAIAPRNGEAHLNRGAALMQLRQYGAGDRGDHRGAGTGRARAAQGLFQPRHGPREPGRPAGRLRGLFHRPRNSAGLGSGQRRTGSFRPQPPGASGQRARASPGHPEAGEIDRSGDARARLGPYIERL